MASSRSTSEAIRVRKAKAKARIRALKGDGRECVMSLVGTIDSKWLKGPLIFDKVRIPESELDADADDA